MSLADKLRQSGVTAPQNIRTALWAGPAGEGPQGGVTFSLLSRFLGCRQRFYLLAVKGLKTADQFNHRIEYGQMWHLCEEELAQGGQRSSETPSTFAPLRNYCLQLCRRYPTQQEQIDHWMNVCKTQFPIYQDYWDLHPDTTSRQPVFQEEVFDVPYELPSGRMVRLRGKWDSVDVLGTGKHAGVYLMENKTKGDIREEQLKRQLTFDLQTMLYTVALCHHLGSGQHPPLRGIPVRGVRYNVIRRPLSGGKGTIVRHKPSKSNPLGESKEDYYNRLAGIIRDAPEEFFMRWKVETLPIDIRTFCDTCLDPILEQLCLWHHVAVLGKKPYTLPPGACSWRHPYGVWNVLDDGGTSDLDDYLYSGSMVGLQTTSDLFPELTP